MPSTVLAALPWGAIGWIVSTLLVAVTAWLTYLQIAKPSLDWKQTYSRPVLGEREQFGGAIKVTVGNSNPPDPHVFAVRVGNYGRKPIAPSDFEGPLVLDLGDTYILSMYITETNPDTLSPEIGPEEDVVGHLAVVEPLLLNPGDWFEAQAFTNGEVTDFQLRGRVKNVTTFRDRMDVEARADRLTTILAPVFVLSLTIGLSAWLSPDVPWYLLVAVGAGAFTASAQALYLSRRTGSYSQLLSRCFRRRG